jgi:putative membrane protein
MGSVYDWLRGLHIIAVIAWMAGLMMLPRLFVYHMQADPGSKMEQVLKDGERRLLRIVMNPAMSLAFLLGLSLIWYDATYVRGDGWRFLLHPWMLTKLAGVLFLLWWHHFLAKARKRFETGTNTRSERFWRMTNDLPFLAAIVMVLAVTTEFGG